MIKPKSGDLVFQKSRGGDTGMNPVGQAYRLEGTRGTRVIFLGFMFFVLEFVLLHVLQYINSYLEATSVISYALLGIGVGGFASAKIKCSDNQMFLASVLGCWVFLFLSLWKIIRFPSVDFSNLILSGLFFFPGFYLSKIFRTHDSHQVYFLDLLGAGVAVLFLFVAYQYFSSEYIILGMFLIFSLGGLITVSQGRHSPKALIFIFVFLFLSSSFLSLWHYKTRSLDLFKMTRSVRPTSRCKMKGYQDSLLKSYDNLISRVEVIRGRMPGRFLVNYFGCMNDNFRDQAPAGYVQDNRIVRGLIHKPRIYILGASAEGVVKVAKSMTDQDKISGIEINPAIYQIMTRDFVKESGDAYSGVDIKLGNAIADLKSRPSQYDIITLMNAHSMPRIGFLGPPDFLHTQEFYKNLFAHLTDEGYLMMEERPFSENFRHPYAVYRLINTLFQTLKASGVENPEENFFIYNDIYPYRKALVFPFFAHKIEVFLFILVREKPFSEEDQKKIIQWTTQTKPGVEVNYLGGYFADKEYGKLFYSLRENKLEENYPGKDLSVLTRDRPFPSAVDPRYQNLVAMLTRLGPLSLLLLFLIGWDSMRGIRGKWMNLRFLSYQAMIGLAYIVIEILFINIYQQEFISTSRAFVATFTTLLISSALGGRFLCNVRNHWAIVFVTTISFLLHWLLMFPGMHLFAGYRVIVVLTLIAISGFFMGYYFPMGLTQAKERGLETKAGHYFAFNCIAGAFAVALSLYLSVRWGFSRTLAIAAMMYVLAPGFLSFRIPRQNPQTSMKTRLLSRGKNRPF